jgi:hypothetical protein
MQPLAVYLHPATAASQPAAGHMASNWTSLNLAAAAAAAAGGGEVLLLLDPRCGYSLVLQPDPLAGVPAALLAHAAVAAGMAASLMLLVVSQQVAAARRLAAGQQQLLQVGLLWCCHLLCFFCVSFHCPQGGHARPFS